MIINNEKIKRKVADQYVAEFLTHGKLEPLMAKTGYTRNQLLYLLWHWNVERSKILDVAYTTIQSDKIMAISDLHYGSTLENQDQVETAMRTAIRKRVPVIINGGDLVQSIVNNYDKRFPDIESQTQHALELYPRIRGIEHHITLGNHDHISFFKDPSFLAALRERPDFKTIDFKRCYYKWGDFTFTVEHQCDSFNCNIPKIHTDFVLQGHSHFFKIEDGNRIILPTLSSDIKFAARPGFLILYNNGNEIQVEEYEFNKGRLTEPQKVLTLTKR